MRILKFKTKKGKELILPEPTVKDCEGIFNPIDGYELVDAATNYLAKNQENLEIKIEITAQDIVVLQIVLKKWLEDIKKNPAYQVPPVQSTAQELPYKMATAHIKAVVEYAKISYIDVLGLAITDFWKLYRDAVIYYYGRTEQGVRDLKAAKAMSSTEPDREALRKSGFLKIRRS